MDICGHCDRNMMMEQAFHSGLESAADHPAVSTGDVVPPRSGHDQAEHFHILILAAISAVHPASRAALLHVPDAASEPSQRSFILGSQRLPMNMVQVADTETGRVNMPRLVSYGKRYCRDVLGLDPDQHDSLRLERFGPSVEHTLPRGHMGYFMTVPASAVLSSFYRCPLNTSAWTATRATWVLSYRSIGDPFLRWASWCPVHHHQ